MKKNILSEVNRVRKIMGVELLKEQVQSPPYDLYTLWTGDYVSDKITSKEFSDKKLFKAGFITYMGPFGKDGYVVLMPDQKRVDGIGEISEPMITSKYPAIGGNVDNQLFKIEDRKFKPKQNLLYGGKLNWNEGNPQNLAMKGQYQDLWELGNQAKALQSDMSKGGGQIKTRFHFLAYAKITNNDLTILNVNIRLEGIDELKAAGKKDNTKNGTLSINNYVKQKRGKAWHLEYSQSPLAKYGTGEFTPDIPDEPDFITDEYEFDAGENFDFDSAELTQLAKDAIKEKIIDRINDLGEYKSAYLKELGKKPIIITAYSSIDADSETPGGGGDFGPCQSIKKSGKRKDYNKCLSQYRANTVVTYLQDTYSNIFGKVKLKGVGGGENPSKNSWKLDKKNHDPDTTQKDRKFTITLPGFTVRRKVG